MILQKIQIPILKEKDESRELYVRRMGSIYRYNTYFNAFSLEKWLRYTVLKDLYVSFSVVGTVEVRVWNLFVEGDDVQRKLLVQNTFSAEEKAEEEMEIPLSGEEKGIVYIEVEKAEQNSEVFDMAYGTYTEPVNEVSLALDICTYKREKYVLANLTEIEKKVIENKESPLYHKLHIFVIDNGKTLQASSGDWIHLYSNKNAGGTAGFTRGMLEIGEAGIGITNVILMDDDVAVSVEAIEKTYILLCFMKEAYKEAFIGGAMLRMDYPYLQQEAGAAYDAGCIRSFHRGMDLRKEKNILMNEQEEAVQYNAWWYCCVPMNLIKKMGYPLPLFIHEDDVEYGLRAGKKVILLNGICVWHNSFENKRPSVNEYYDVRNSLIINAIYAGNYSRKDAERLLLKRVITNLFRYRYKDAMLNLLAAQDYMKGISWLEMQDGEALHQKIMSLGYRYNDENESVPKSSGRITEEDIVLGRTNSNQISKKKLLTFNGWLLPTYKQKDIKFIMAGESPHEYYRQKKVFIYDPDTGKGFYAQKSWKELLAVIKQFRKVNRLGHKEFEAVQSGYRQNYKKLCSKEFWYTYLKTQGGR